MSIVILTLFNETQSTKAVMLLVGVILAANDQRKLSNAAPEGITTCTRNLSSGNASDGLVQEFVEVFVSVICAAVVAVVGKPAELK